MELSKEGLSLLKQFEGLSLTSYPDSKGVWTIGFGTIKYENGAAVKPGETITMERAEALLMHEVKEKTKGIKAPNGLNQNQFDALVILAYNIGTGGFNRSTVKRLADVNPDDPAIRNAFLMWNKIKDPVTKKMVVVRGLINRREAEADYYFK